MYANVTFCCCFCVVTVVSFRYEEGLKFIFCLETLVSQIPPRSPKYIDRRFIRQIQQLITEKYSAELSVRIMSCGDENLEKV